METTIEIIPFETDVLIIGGGLAGCMAAIKAAEWDVSVTIVEKADTRASMQIASNTTEIDSTPSAPCS